MRTDRFCQKVTLSVFIFSWQWVIGCLLLWGATLWAQEPAATPPAPPVAATPPEASPAPAPPTAAPTPPVTATPPAPPEAAPAAPVSPATPPTPPTPPAAPATPPTPPATPPEKQAPPPVDESVPPTPPEEKLENPWKTFDPKKSYVQLLIPRVANRLGLNDVQRAEVQRLVNERAQKLAALPVDQKELWEPVLLESEAKLAAVLTAEQKELWPKVFADKKIVFIFNNQKWEDVLNMFADMAGLQLVMDAPPPGTFNYSDSIEYTPGEAIDKLNSVLQTKGYTLVRNGNMLMLFNLAKGRIPNQFVPNIRPEDLAGRGDFEFSTVVFPLGRRNRSLVLQTIEPFKGEYCHILPMTGNSLMITDTAGALRVIDKAIQGVYEPPAPPEPEPPQHPTWQAYAFEKIDVAEIETIIKEFYPTLKVLRLGNSKQIYIFTTPAEHATIKAIVTMLDTIAEPQEKRTVVAYPVDTLLNMTPQRLWQAGRRSRNLVTSQIPQMPLYPGFNPLDTSVSVPKEIASVLKYAAPSAIVSETPINDKLVVLATAEDHATIKTLIDALRSAAVDLPPEEQPVVKLYRFADAKKKLDTETVKMVQSLVPENQVLFDEENSRLLVVATAKEHEKIAQAVKEIEAAVVPVEDRSLVVYRLPAAAVNRLHQALVQLRDEELKGIVELRDGRAGAVSVIATAKQHEVIRKLVGDLVGRSAAPGAKPGKAPEMRIDVLKTEKGSAATAYQLFLGMFPNVDFQIDYARNALVAYGAVEDLNVLKLAFDELIQGDSQEILFVPLRRELPAPVVTSLSRIAPRAVVQIDRENKQAILYGTAAELEKLQDAIAQAQNVEPPREDLLIYVPKFGMEPFTARGAAATVLAERYPEAKITPDSAGRRLMIRVAPADKEPLQKLLETLDIDPAEGEELFLYSPKKIALPTAMNMIATQLPRIQVSSDPAGNRLVARLRPGEKEKLLALLAKIDVIDPAAADMLIYTPKNMTGIATVLVTLREIYPDAKFTQDVPNNRLVIRLAETDKKDMLALLEQLDVDAAAAEEIFVYSPKKMPLHSISALATGQFPNLRVTPDPANNRLIFRLRPGEKEKLVALLEKIDVVDPNKAAMLVFSPKHIDPATARMLLVDIYPDARITHDTANNRLVIQLAVEDKEPVEALLAQLDTLDPDAPKRSFKAYPISVGAANATAFVQEIQKLVPKAKLTFDMASSQLVVWGTEEEQKIVADAIGNLQDTAGAAKRFKRVPVNRADAGTLITTLYRMYPYPSITVSYDTQGRTLVLEGHPNVLKQAAELLALLDPEEPGPNAPVVRFYALNAAPSQVLIDSLTRLVPTAGIVPDKESRQLMVIAPLREQKEIAANLKEIVETFTTPEEPMLFIYRANEEEKRRIEAFVQTAKSELEGLSIVPDETPGQLSVWAKPAEHKMLALVLEQMKATGDEASAKALKVFSFKIANTQLAGDTLRIAVPEAIIIPDAEGERILIWGDETTLEKADAVLTQLDEPDEKRRFTLGVYSFGDADPLMVESTLRSIVPDAESTSSDDLVFRLGYQHRMERTYGYNMRQLARRRTMPDRNAGIFRVDPEQRKVFVFVSAADHKIVEEAMLSLSKSFENTETKLAKRFELRRTSAREISASVSRVFPSALVTVEAQGNALIVEAYAKTLEEVEKLIRSLDPETPGPNDPVVRFYALESEPTPMLLQSLRQIAPTAGVYPDVDANQVMVIARQQEHARIAESVQSILDSYTVPEEPILVVYPVAEIDKPRVTSFIATARRKLRSMVVVPDRQPGQLAVWGTPTEQDMLRAALEEFKRGHATETSQTLQVFTLEPANMTAAQQIVTASYPGIRLFPDSRGGRIIAWGEPEILKQVAKHFEELEGKSGPKMFRRYVMKRAEPYSMLAIIKRMYPNVTATFDYPTLSIVVEAFEEDHAKITDLIAELDPAEPGPNDPVVKFYKLEARPSPILLSTLARLVPTATVQPDPNGKQLMVVARPNEHALFARSLQRIIETYTAIEDPVLVIYPVDDQEKLRLTAFITTARSELRNLQVVPDNKSGQLAVWATPTEHTLLTTVLKQIQASKENEVAMELKSFPMSSADLQTARQVLTAAHPEAKVFTDAANGRLLVWGPTALLEKVAETLRIQVKVDDRQMLAYPVLASKTATMREVIMNVYPGLKISVDDRARRILVWATPQEHTKIAEIVEQANKDFSGDGESAELAEKFAAYAVPNLDPASLSRIVTTLMPDVRVYADPTSERLIVLARTREHEELRTLVDQLGERDPKNRPVLEIYPFGETDPVMLEGLLRSILPNAESTTGNEIVAKLGQQYLQRNQYARQMRRGASRQTGYFNVDLNARSAVVFVLPDEQKDVAEAIKRLLAVDQSGEGKPTLRRYVLDEMNFYEAQTVLQQVAPAAVFSALYTYSPAGRAVGFRRGGENYREFIAYARQQDHERIAATVKEMNAGTSAAGTKTIGMILIPAGSTYERSRIITTIQTLFPDANPTEGAAPNQILIWGGESLKARVQQVVDEACRPLPKEQQSVYKTYPIQYAVPAELVKWLKNIAPNATFEPSQVKRAPYREDTKALVVLATPLEHLEIARAITELDKDAPDEWKAAPRFYSLAEFPAGTYWPVYMSLYRTFPDCSLLPGNDQTSLTVVATAQVHERIEIFLKKYLEQQEQGRRYLEIYSLTRTNFQRVVTILTRIAPTATVTPGNSPEKVVVLATAREQREIADALKKLEMEFSRRPAGAEGDESGLKVYKIAGRRAISTATLVQQQFTGAIVRATDEEQLLVWASPSDHDKISQMVGAIAEAYPELTLKTYFVKHIPIGEAYLALSRLFASEAFMTLRRDTGDLMVRADDAVHARIARNLEQLDQPRPQSVEKQARAYDLSDLPDDRLPLVANTIRAAIPEVAILPGAVAGQLILWGREAEQEKAGAIIHEVLQEREATSAVMQTYVLKQSSAVAATTLLRQLAPNARFNTGRNANQLLVWAKPTDHRKIADAVEKMNQDIAGMAIETYSLKNMNEYTAARLVGDLLTNRGISLTRMTHDYYGSRLFVEADPETQTLIGDMLAKMKTEDRDLEVFRLEKVDLETARMAVYALFADESADAAPRVEIDLYTNTLFLRGTREQIDRTRKMLVKMGETHLADDAAPGAAIPGRSSKLRVIHVEGNVEQTIKEIEKLWPQINRAPLHINRQDKPLIQKKEEESNPPASEAPKNEATPPAARRGGGFFAVNDPVGTEPAASPQQASGPADVYMIVNEDGSLMITSSDTRSLDQLQQLLERINSRVVFEGRDYTIYSVRNVSANDVVLKLQLVLRDRLRGLTALPRTRSQYGFGYQTPRVPLEITPEINSNTIYVKGSKAERNEVEELIAMFDVSELPGERIVRKPIRVHIKNTQAYRIAQQVLNVYQQKLMTISLPGGVRPRITPDNLTNSLDIIAPEPLATELKEYAEELDRKIVEEPARKVHVIPLKVNSRVIMEAMNVIRQSQAGYAMPTPYGAYPAVYPMQQPMYYPGR